MADISENSNVKTNLGFMAKVLTGVISAVLGYSALYHKLKEMDMAIMRLEHEVHMNSEFRIRWPRGEIGALPDDSEQNMRLNFIEKQMSKHEGLLDELRFGEKDG